MKARKEQKLRDLQEQERMKQIEKGISPKFMEFSNEIIEAGPEDEEDETGVKDMEEFRQMKFNKDDSANAVETKKSVAEFDPNFGVRVGEGKRFQKSPSKAGKDKPDLNPSNIFNQDNSLQNDSPEIVKSKPSIREYFTRRS